MLVIDCHDHIYHKKLAPMAVKGVGEFYDVPMACSGTGDDLALLATSSPIKLFVVNSVALTPSTVKRLNTFVAEQCKAHKEFIGLGTLHPDMENADEEIERIISLGLKGIKLHPDTQKFDADSDKAMKLYEKFAGKLPLLIHGGDYRYDYSHPKRLQRIEQCFPELMMIAAHLGGWSIYEEAVPYMSKMHCYMDISSVMPFLKPEKVQELIRLYGADRLLFGSDYPMWDPVKEYESFMRLDLTENEREKILFRNCAKIFGIDTEA